MLYPTVTITPMSIESLSSIMSSSAPSSSAWPSANRAIYIPFRLYKPITAVKMFTVNGATASGNLDVGIYSVDGRRLVSSGTTAQSGTSAIQEFDITDTYLYPGIYYMALAVDNGTATFFRKGTNVSTMRAWGCAQQASAFVLPTTLTFSTLTGSYCPIFGLSTRSVI